MQTPISLYYFFDNLLLSDLRYFSLQITEIEHPCNDDFTLSIPFNAAFEYQWYFNGIALVGENDFELSQNYGEGFYEVRIIDNGRCSVSEKFEYKKPVLDAPVSIDICEGDVYPFGNRDLTTSGVYIDTFKNRFNCDSIVTLTLNVIGDALDTLEATIFEGENFELGNNTFNIAGEYPVTLQLSLIDI